MELLKCDSGDRPGLLMSVETGLRVSRLIFVMLLKAYARHVKDGKARSGCRVYEEGVSAR